MPGEDQSALGCSKCRFSKRGCKRCKDPAFQKRKRKTKPSPSSQPPRGQKRKQITPAAVPADPPEPAVHDTQEALQAGAGPYECRTSASASAVASDKAEPEGHQEPPKAPPPDSSAVLANHDSAPLSPPAAAKHPQRCDGPSPVANDAEATQSPTAESAGAKPLHDSTAKDSTAKGNYCGAQHSQDLSGAADHATKPTIATPGLSSQGTASDSRPSFLSMLQSKMEKRRQERRESQSAGSASDSSLSSVHAPGNSSAEKTAGSVDSEASCKSAVQVLGIICDRLPTIPTSSVIMPGSGQTPADFNADAAGYCIDFLLCTQAPQAMAAPRHKVKQRKRRSAKKPAKTRAFLQAGADPRQALWHPPASPYGLIEEILYEDPWKLLVACMLLNVTSGRAVRKVIWRLFAIWPSAEAAAEATDDTLVIVEKLIQPLGLFRKRTMAIKRFSQEYLAAECKQLRHHQPAVLLNVFQKLSKSMAGYATREQGQCAGLQWLDPIELHGIGQYASDAYFMFCRGNWQDVEPSDKDLLKYQQWLHSTGGEGTGLERDAMPDVTTQAAHTEPS